MVTDERATFKSSARNRMHASLARPSIGGAVTASFRAPSSSPRTWFFLAFGCRRMPRLTPDAVSRMSITGFGLSPKIAVPTRTQVDPSADRHFEIVRHAHGKLIDRVAAQVVGDGIAQLAKIAEVGPCVFGIFGEGRNGHQSADSQVLPSLACSRTRRFRVSPVANPLLASSPPTLISINTSRVLPNASAAEFKRSASLRESTESTGVEQFRSQLRFVRLQVPDHVELCTFRA